MTQPNQTHASRRYHPPWRNVRWAIPAFLLGLFVVVSFALPRVEVPFAVAVFLGLSVWVTPFVAAYADASTTTARWLVGSAWAALTTSLLLSSLTAQWRNDDGLGTGLVIQVLVASVAVYSVFVVGLFMFILRQSR
jgi:hypothetical protein